MMFHVIVILVIIVVSSVWKYNHDKEEEVEEMTGSVPTDSVIKHETRDLVLETLAKMGGNYIEDENQGIIFSYQGHQFKIIAENDCPFIEVYDLWWHHLSAYCEVEEFAYLQKAINKVNQSATCTVLYTINKEADEIGVHSKVCILFIRQIPNIEGYLIHVLDDFFQVERTVLTEIERVKVAEEQ